MGRGTRALIDLAALRRNFAAVRSCVDSRVKMLVVVKADGYGHSAKLVAPALVEAGADWLGVATIEEGIELRSVGISKPILVLAGSGRGDVEALREHRLSAALLDVDMAHDLASTAKGWPIPVHIKIDSGMGRLGVRPEQLQQLLQTIQQLDCFRVEGVFSHFGNADRVDRAFSDSQVATFSSAVATIREMGLAPEWIHLANSAATIARPQAHFSMVRPGIVLYGVAPSGTVSPVPLQPVMRVESRILQVKSLPAGVPVSYGQTYTTQRQTRCAVVPIGYADGYARAHSNRAFMLVRGRRVPVIGAVCMDLTMLDVTEVPEAQAGDEVVLWGRQGDEEIRVAEVGEWQGSVDYEVLIRLGKRVPRIGIN